MVYDSRTSDPGILNFDFEPFNNNGIRVGYNPFREWLLISDSEDAIVGTTALDRHKEFLERITAVSKFLAAREDRAVNVLFAPCSIGLEPLSFVQKHTKAGISSDQIKTHALDLITSYLQCFNTRVLPRITVSNVANDPSWQGHIEDIDEHTVKLADSLYDAITVKPPQNLLNHSETYDIAACFHLLYHLEREQAAMLLKHLCTIANIVAIDKATYDQQKVGISVLMENQGFETLNAHVNAVSPPKPHTSYKPKKKGEGIIFCRREMVPSLAFAMQDEPSWQEIPETRPAIEAIEP